MDLPSLRSMALADIGEAELEWMARHGEELLVECKVALPDAPGLGAEVASFANTIGGWLLLGIDNHGKSVGWDPGKLDRQAHIGDLLRNQVDPVPPFVAGERELDGKSITVVRVLESSDAPVLVRGTGALYLRDAGGKHPIRDHATLMALAQRGRQAEQAARLRLHDLPLVMNAMRPPDGPASRSRHPQEFRVLVRASPLTITPQFSAWPIKGPRGWFSWEAMRRVFRLPNEDNLIEEFRPGARGLVAMYRCITDPHETKLRIVADSGGVIAASLTRPVHAIGIEGLGRDFLMPLIHVIGNSLEGAEAMGRGAWDTWITAPIGANVRVESSDHTAPVQTHCAGSLTIPAGDDERAELARQWQFEFGRACGLELWEPGLD